MLGCRCYSVSLYCLISCACFHRRNESAIIHGSESHPSLRQTRRKSPRRMRPGALVRNDARDSPRAGYVKPQPDQALMRAERNLTGVASLLCRVSTPAFLPTLHDHAHIFRQTSFLKSPSRTQVQERCPFRPATNLRSRRSLSRCRGTMI